MKKIKLTQGKPDPDEVLAAIQSFNDPSIITNIFKELNWSYSLEIKETLMMAKQNANLSIKFKAIKHLRELLREAAETSGYIANVSQTMPNAQGGHTTFNAKRIANILNPTKQIESTIKESQDDKKRLQSIESSSGCDREKPNRGSDRGQGQTEGQSCRPTGECNLNTSSSEPERDTGRANSERDADSGGTEPPDGEETSGQRPRRGGKDDGDSKGNGQNPCIKTRPPSAGDGNLFRGISSADSQS